MDNETLYYLYNGHADVTSLLDNNGAIVAYYYYDAFGNHVQDSTNEGDVDNPIRYAGYQWDKETGLYYLNARFYDATIARFIQEDTYRGTANDPLSLNLYVYCTNNPLIYHDPTGHNALSIAIKIKKAANLTPWGFAESVFEKIVFTPVKTYDSSLDNLPACETSTPEVMATPEVQGPPAPAVPNTPKKSVPKAKPKAFVPNKVFEYDGDGTYTVVSGDTLSTIAQHFGTTVQNLLDLNPGISPTKFTIYPGQEIKLYPDMPMEPETVPDVNDLPTENESAPVVDLPTDRGVEIPVVNGIPEDVREIGMPVVNDMPIQQQNGPNIEYAERSKNNLKPDPDADGSHSTFKRDPKTGEITNYKTWEPNPKNPMGFDPVKGYDGVGAPHTNKVTGEDLMPHIHEKTIPGGVRPPFPWEIPLRK